jgi:molecular chaperone HtpG
MGETLLDLQHLLEGIRDAYPGSLEETIVTEIVANALDSRAAVLRFETDSAASTLTVIHDGSGLSRRDLARAHDIGARAKSRRRGIGCAGVGVKLALLACEDVLTETKRGKKEVATLWQLASRDKAPWRRVLPRGLVRGRGTAVRMRARSALSPLLEPGFLEAVLRRRFQPLFDPSFDEVLEPHYPLGLRMLMNGEVLARRGEAGDRRALAVPLGRKRTLSAVGYLARHDEPRPDDEQGLALSTLGRVIRRGWDWLGITPSDPRRTSGLIEVPGLAESLSPSKTGFVRSGARGALYLAYRKKLRKAVVGSLAAWGAPKEPRHARMLMEAEAAFLVTGLSIQFESRPDDANLGRLAETTLWVNESHPAYLKAAASRSEGYHLALTLALALAPQAAEPSEVLSFITTFLSKWGELTERASPRGARQGPPMTGTLR